MKNNNNEARFSAEELAMDLLDFCGGAHPTSNEMHEWMKRRGFNFKQERREIIMMIAEMFLQETPPDFQFN